MDSDYTHTWAPSGEVRYLALAGSLAGTDTESPPARLRYLKVGTGPALVLLHTVRTQLDHFQLVIPRLWDDYTVYALDLPGMGWSDPTPMAGYEERALRAAVVALVTGLDLHEVTLAGESMGAVLSLTAATELGDRVRRVVAVNPYDYADGIARANPLARLVVGTIRLPLLGPVVARSETSWIVRAILRGGLADPGALPDHYLAELRRVGRRADYPTVARAIYRNLDSLIAARAGYPDVTVPITLVYGELDWSRPSDRDANERLLPRARRVDVSAAGHFLALERPQLLTAILRDRQD